MTNKNKTHIYTLSFAHENDPIVFYVGRTNDPQRRESEHRSIAARGLDLTDKYQVIRELDENGVQWSLTVVAENINDDSDSEYEWVLLFARHNITNGISFIDDSPLTNLKNGDIFNEMIDDHTVVTNTDIKKYRATKKISTRKLQIAKNYSNTWTAIDQASAIRQLFYDMLKIFNIKEKELSKSIYEITRQLPTQRSMLQHLLELEPSPKWTARQLDDFLVLVELADELGLL